MTKVSKHTEKCKIVEEYNKQEREKRHGKRRVKLQKDRWLCMLLKANGMKRLHKCLSHYVF